jgi:hypothetical protein
VLRDRWLPGGIYHRAFQPIEGFVSTEEITGEDMTSSATLEALTLDKAALYYVTEEMCDLLQHAAPTMPEQTLMLDDPPFKWGFIYFEKGLMGWDAKRGIPLRVDAIAWHTSTSGPKHLRPNTPICSITSYTFDDKPIPPELVEQFPDLGGKPMNEWAPLGRSDWPAGDTTDQPEWDTMTEDEQKSFSEDRRWLMAFWTLIGQVKSVETTAAPVPRPVRRREERAKQKIPDIRIIRLRRVRSDHRTTGETHREYSHRWWVSGHWKNVWLPSRKTHRHQYIMPYVAGPEDKPLVIKEEVRLWQR